MLKHTRKRGLRELPIEIIIGPPGLTINQGSTFMVTAIDGRIEADSEQGIFASDTRFVSYYEITANGEPWKLLTSATTDYFAARINLINAEIKTEDSVLPAGTIGLSITRSIGEGIHEDVDVTNYGLVRANFNLEITIRSDFADLFEVKAHDFVRRGRIISHWNQATGEYSTVYTNGAFKRGLTYRLLNSGSEPHYANGRVSLAVDLAPGETWHCCCFYVLDDGTHKKEPLRLSHDAEMIQEDRLQELWKESATQITTANEDVYRLYRQSVEDMGGLRLHEHDLAPEVWMPAAGVPWFVTIFGRDSLIVSLQNMMVHAGFALGTLTRLAELQAKEVDDWRDAQPGKIPHELRFGELAALGRIPHTPYYGTADATPLFVILLHEAWKWMGDDQLLHQFREVALGCLEWIDNYGDLDGDGFQEYQTRSSKGYENMGWKDAGDAIVYPDGSQVKQPKALCELQGYVFDAWLRAAEIFDVLGEQERSASLRAKAAHLQKEFEERFWCEDTGFYALALDPDKEPVRTIASNPGHCLWSGIVSREHAAKVVRRLMEPDMWSGWGIRTLSSRNGAFNPFSYQLGSVWPHDNGIIATGFKRYGFSDEAARIARDISEVGSNCRSYRLPELYSGTERRPGTFPTQYLGANVPQAWAAGSVFHLIQALLGLRGDAPRKKLLVNPTLPRWLPDLTLRGLAVGKDKLDLRFWREGETSRWEVLHQEADIQVQEEAWQPWDLPR
jgi:glycogen debranching enzyme